MPRAVVTTEDQKRFDLKTLPPANGEEGGFVVIRRMPYGEYITRREMATSMTMKGQNGKDVQGVINALNAEVVKMEFAKCIVEHNLDDANGNRLDFKGPVGLTILDPRVGEEISKYIGEMNNFDEALGESGDGSLTSSSSNEPNEQTSPS